MNQINLIGRLTKDPEIRMTSTGKKVASFSLAVDDGKDQSGQKLTQFFNCTAWEKLADILELYVKKGTMVRVSGKLQNRSWDKPDGTKAYATDVAARELDILSSKSSTSEEGGSSPMASTSSTQSNPAKPAAAKAKEEEEALPEINVDDLNVQMPF